MNMLAAISVEMLKVRHSRILWISVLAAIFFPLLIGLVMAGSVGTNPAVVVEQTPEAYLMQFEIVVAIGGLIGFGFIFSWIFGREYHDGTVTDLLALPIPRTHIVAAKFLVAGVWCAALALLQFAIGGWYTGSVLPGPSIIQHIVAGLGKYVLTSMMVISLSMTVPFIASIGRGYLGALGFVILTIVAAQLFGAIGIAEYFPWAVPGLHSGVAGEEAMQLGLVSLLLPFVVGLVGVAVTLAWWRYADQT